MRSVQNYIVNTEINETVKPENSQRFRKELTLRVKLFIKFPKYGTSP